MISINVSGETISSLFMFCESFSISVLRKFAKISICFCSYFFASSSACLTTKMDRELLDMSIAVSGRLWASSTIRIVRFRSESRFLRNAALITGLKT